MKAAFRTIIESVIEASTDTSLKSAAALFRDMLDKARLRIELHEKFLADIDGQLRRVTELEKTNPRVALAPDQRPPGGAVNTTAATLAVIEGHIEYCDQVLKQLSDADCRRKNEVAEARERLTEAETQRLARLTRKVA
jgi:hypothetical protein